MEDIRGQSLTSISEHFFARDMSVSGSHILKEVNYNRLVSSATCRHCGKTFSFTCSPKEYGYRRKINGKERLYCSYSCMRAEQKEFEAQEQARHEAAAIRAAEIYRKMDEETRKSRNRKIGMAQEERAKRQAEQRARRNEKRRQQRAEERAARQAKNKA